jgi:hypothetical protein
VLGREPAGVVFSKGFSLNGDDLLEERYCLLDLVVGLVGYCERMLRREPVRVVLDEMMIPLLINLFQTPNSFLDPSIRSQALSNPE